MRKALIPALLAALVATSLPGCGDDGGDIPVSEDAPKQADFDAMKDMMNKNAKVKPSKKADAPKADAAEKKAD
ncbi:MAG: hypothetical protein BGO49_28220 [Planctomycetales bacterium 71-10]|nr:MAG: hypothetical protein BGO49_28220 [Planctomycetales bacterium 71-10]